MREDEPEKEKYRNQNKKGVFQVSDGIARIYGFNEVMAGELVEFE